MQYLLSANVVSDPTIHFNDVKVHLRSLPLFKPEPDGWHYLTVEIKDTEIDSLKGLYALLAKVYESWTDKDKQPHVCGGVLRLADASEWTWKLDELYFVSINFGDLDFSSCEDVTIELTMKCRRCDLESIKISIDPWLPKNGEGECKTILPYDSSVALDREEKRGIMITSGSGGHHLVLADEEKPTPRWKRYEIPTPDWMLQKI